MAQRNILAAAALLCGTLVVPSLAQAATATSAVNVRSGPGTSYGVVDQLRAGQQVEIDRCVSSGWCYVVKSGPDGWVSRNYLRDDDAPAPSRPSPSRPDVNIGFAIPGFSFQIGDGGFNFDRPRPGRPGFPGRPGGPGFPGGPGGPGGPGFPGGPGADEVCFYEDSNFRGASFCADPGDRIANLGRWNDRISSIRVRGWAEALVCEDSNFRGQCTVISRDVRDLGPRGNDRISSIRVR